MTDRDFSTQHGVFGMQTRIIDLVNRLAAEKGVRLDPGHPSFFDGSMSLPEPGAPWKVTLRSGGESESVLLAADELADFKAGRLSIVMSRIEMALNALHRKR